MSKASRERRAAEREGLGHRQIDVSARGARAPMDIPMYFRAGYDLLMEKNYQQAERFFRQALDLIPDRPRVPEIRAKIHLNIGLCVLERRDYDQAIEHFEAAQRLDPLLPNALKSMLLPLIYSDRKSSAELFADHEKYGRVIEKEAGPPLEPRAVVLDPARKLRIGFVSGDFLGHVVMSFFEPLLRNIDRSAFDITCYYEAGENAGKPPRRDVVTDWVEANVDRFRISQGIRAADLAWQIGADEIDVLIDMSGHTSHGRLDVFALQPAPVQMTMIGYPHSTGLRRIGWRVVDAVTDPPGAEAQSTEKLYRMPLGFSCYLPRSDAPDVAPPPSAGGAPIVFGSFNLHRKLSESTLRTWAKILEAVPGSRLLIKSLDLDIADVRERFVAKAAAAGIDSERLEIVAPTATILEHLEMYSKIDIALDPFPYNGTTTFCETSWQGVPVVALRGTRHSGRVAASFLHQLGLDELVAEDRKGYVETAVRLARDPVRLAALRAGMRERMLASPLCDAAGYGKRFGAMLRDVWGQRCAEQGAAAVG